MAFQPIENYGVIGNLRTAALVGMDSSVDFFCFPDFDSPTVFAALLDPSHGGQFSVRPSMPDMQFRQMYIAETNILVSRFLSENAAAEVCDFMPLTSSAQKNELVRIVRVIHGEAKFSMQCQPAFDYARAPHSFEMTRHGAAFRPANSERVPLLLRATVPLEISSSSAVSTFTLRKNQEAAFILGPLEEESDKPLTREEINRNFDETLLYWRNWSAKSSYRGRWREAVSRSALALKLLTSRRYGALLAAPTFSLPEHIGGTRNWDYRYVWLRDAAFTLYAFMRLGLYEEADQFFHWLENQVDRSVQRNRPLQIMYGIDGRIELNETELPHLRGYRDSKPVRIGNAAWDQLQLDIFGELMDAVYLHSKYRHALAHRRWEEIKSLLAWLAENWNQPDDGIWEVRGGNRHFLHSRLMCWVAFDRGIRLVHKRSLSAPLGEWYVQRDMILADIYTNFWNPKLGAFVQSKGSEALDASVLLMPLMRIISPVDPMWLSTLNAIEKSLAEDALVYRYRNSQTGDGLEGEEGSFTCCSFWFVECLARAGQIEKARLLFDKLLCHANHLGLFSEQIGRSGHQLGNFPQALTHLALISAATYLDRGLSGQPPKPWG